MGTKNSPAQIDATSIFIYVIKAQGESTEMISRQHEIILEQENEITRLSQPMPERQQIISSKHQISANKTERYQ